MRYKNYTITYNPKPIPDRRFDWDFAHDDYDGAPDSNDFRCGTANGLEDAMSQIDELEDE